jgi:hypothetical protein
MPPAIEMSYLNRLKSQSWLADRNIVSVYPISTTLVGQLTLGLDCRNRSSGQWIDRCIERDRAWLLPVSEH